jgi:hypothetical protein
MREIEIVEILLDKYPMVINSIQKRWLDFQEKDTTTLSMLPYFNCEYEAAVSIIRSLIQHGADVNLCGAFESAIYTGKLEVVELVSIHTRFLNLSDNTVS